MDNAAGRPITPSRNNAIGSMPGGYRTSFRGGNTDSGMHDEVMDTSIKFGDEVAFGHTSAGGAGGADGSARSSTQRKSMVDVFLAEEANGDGESNIVGMQTTEKGARAKKIGMYLCVFLVLGIIFITAPKPGFLFGGGNKHDDSSNSVEATQPPTNTTTTETLAPSEFIDEEVEVNKPPDNAGSAETTTPAQDTNIQVDMTRPQAIKAYVLQRQVSHQAELSNPQSAASQSLAWLAAEDAAQLDIPGFVHNTGKGDAKEQGIQLLQRYALGVFYWAMQDEFNGSNERRRLRRLHDEDQPTAEEEDNEISFENTWTVGSVCEWFGVECDDQSHVTSVNLTLSRLQGTLVTEIFQETALPALTSLDVSHNALFGEFPHHPIANSKLNMLHLEHNKFTKTVDPILKALTNLKNLDVNSNIFTGTLPTDWSALTNLEFVRLHGNNLHGTLPPSMGSISKLEWLQLDSNMLTGTIPAEWSSLSMLQSIKLAHNPITGEVPAFLGDLPLTHISLQDTQLAGDVPTSLGQLTGLKDMHVQFTKLGGTMPEEVCSLVGDGKAIDIMTADCKSQMKCSCCTECF